MFEDKCVWSALYPIGNHSHIRQLQFATHAFSQQVLQQAVQISICQWTNNISRPPSCFIIRFISMTSQQGKLFENYSQLIESQQFAIYVISAYIQIQMNFNIKHV